MNRSFAVDVLEDKFASHHEVLISGRERHPAGASSAHSRYVPSSSHGVEWRGEGDGPCQGVITSTGDRICMYVFNYILQ